MVEVVVDIEHVGQLGQGVGKDTEGNVYFVQGAVPGDRVRVLPQPGEKRYKEALLVAVEKPSPNRVESPCAHFPECGGCDWLHWSYDTQLRAKETMLDRMLERAGLPSSVRRPILPAEPPLHYRRRIQLRREGDALGFYRRKTHDIVPIESCAIAHPALNAELARVRSEPLPAERTKVELALDDEGQIIRAENAPHAARGFSQVNAPQNEKLRAVVASFVESSNSKRVLELFCGDGNLTFAYLPFVDKAVAVDSNEPALERARIKRAEVEPDPPHRAAFLTSQVNARLLSKLPPDFRNSYDTLLLDPPRTGVGASLRVFLESPVQTVIYVSCLPATFSSDAQVLKKTFELVECVPIDMFPQTRHVEFVTRFVRRS